MTTPSAAGSDSDRDLVSLQGTWRSIAMVIDGRRIPAAALDHRRIIVIGDKYVVVDGDRTLRRGALKIDATTRPKQIDALPADGPNVGKIDQGIYELSAEMLWICWAPPGQPRPKTFDSEPGSKRWTVTDQKEASSLAAEPGRVIAVASENSECPGIQLTRVHHRDFPELYGEGATPYEAALVLLRHLIGESGSIVDGWHQDVLYRVVADVRAFVDQVS